MTSRDRTIKLNVNIGEVTLELSYWGVETYRLGDDCEVEFHVSDEDEGSHVSLSRVYAADADGARELAKLLGWLADLSELFDSCEADRIAEAHERKLCEEREAKEKAAQREQDIADREERLLVEFLGEEVKIRERGYQTMRKATVEAVSIWGSVSGDWQETGKYRLHFNYTGQDARTQHVHQIQRLDVKVGSKWETVWDDGTDDLGSWQPLAASAKPTGRMYDGGLC